MWLSMVDKGFALRKRYLKEYNAVRPRGLNAAGFVFVCGELVLKLYAARNAYEIDIEIGR
jgi:hypothetical protein